MSDKKERILQSALTLFANEGFNATSTNKIARNAGVSEGLIFKHFTNKKGLLDAIMHSAEEKAAILFASIIKQNDAKAVIRKTIELPFSIEESAYDYWKLQFKLKWEQEYNNPRKMQPLMDKLIWAFTVLAYENPALEAQLMNQLLDSIATELLKGNLQNANQFRQFLLDKYGV